MPRLLLAVLLILSAAMLPAQVAVTSSGYATQSGGAVPVAVPSPPLMFTPSVHLGESPSTAYYANGLSATLPGVALAQAETEVPPPPPTVFVVAAPPSGAAPNRGRRTAIQFRNGPVLHSHRYECVAL